MKPAVTSAAITQLLDEGGVAVDGTLDVLLGSGRTSVSATDLSVGGTLLITGSPVNLGVNFGLGSDFGLGIGLSVGGFSFGSASARFPAAEPADCLALRPTRSHSAASPLRMLSSSLVSVRPDWSPSKARPSAP